MAHRQACETKCIALEEDEEDEEGAYWKSMGMAWEAVKPLTFWNVHLQRIVARNLFDIDMFELLCSEDTNRAKAGCFLMSRRLSRKPTFSHRSFDVPYYIILHHITILSPHCSRHTWKPLQSLILSMGLVQNRPPHRIRVNLLLQKLSRASEWQAKASVPLQKSSSNKGLQVPCSTILLKSLEKLPVGCEWNLSFPRTLTFFWMLADLTVHVPGL